MFTLKCYKRDGTMHVVGALDYTIRPPYETATKQAMVTEVQYARSDGNLPILHVSPDLDWCYSEVVVDNEVGIVIQTIRGKKAKLSGPILSADTPEEVSESLHHLAKEGKESGINLNLDKEALASCVGFHGQPKGMTPEAYIKQLETAISLLRAQKYIDEEAVPGNDDLESFVEHGESLQDIFGDRTFVCQVISEMLDSPRQGIYRTGDAFDALQSYIQQVRMETLGWCWAQACIMLEKGKDPRKMIIPHLVRLYEMDIKEPVPEYDDISLEIAQKMEDAFAQLEDEDPPGPYSVVQEGKNAWAVEHFNSFCPFPNRWPSSHLTKEIADLMNTAYNEGRFAAIEERIQQEQDEQAKKVYDPRKVAEDFDNATAGRGADDRRIGGC